MKILKKTTYFLIFMSLIAFLAQSCIATKRDCKGVKKHRLNNGIYM